MKVIQSAESPGGPSLRSPSTIQRRDEEKEQKARRPFSDDGWCTSSLTPLASPLQTAAIASRVVLARLAGSVQFNPRINSWRRLAAASPDTPPYPHCGEEMHRPGKCSNETLTPDSGLVWKEGSSRGEVMGGQGGSRGRRSGIGPRSRCLSLASDAINTIREPL